MAREFWEEKRKFPRIKFDASIGYQYKGESQVDYTLTKDLSEGGLGLILDKFLPRDSELIVEFLLEKDREPLRAKTRLAWIGKLPYAPRFRAGLEFKEIDSSYKINLTRFLKNRTTVPGF